MRMTEEDNIKWYWAQASDDEKRLYDRMGDFIDELFGDMLFSEGTPSYELIKCQAKNIESDEWYDTEIDLPEELRYFSYTFFKVVIGDVVENAGGCYDKENQTIHISESMKDNDSVLLHEIIHLVENVINELPLYYHDAVYWSLYSDLKTKIEQLDDAISRHTHLLNQWDIYRIGGLHDILFLLKSFDLDLRMGYPLGTVLAYDGTDDFKDIKLKS